MHIMIDTRPTTELLDIEIVAYLFKSLRAQQMKTANQVKAECDRLFPDLTVERKGQCLALLAQKLS